MVPGFYHRDVDRLTYTPVTRDVVMARGADAVSYVDSQFTQDVASLADGESAWSFLLTPKSQIIALVRITKLDADSVVIDTEPGLGAVVQERIDGFLFRTDVTFTAKTWDGFAVRGPGSADVAAQSPVAMVDPWPGEDGLDIIGPEVSAPTDAEEIGVDELDALRIRLGWPSMADIPEGTTPAMTGIVGHTVSFTKGCYTGQEFVARVHYREAAPPRRLVQVGFHPCSQPAVGNELAVDDDVVGEITSVSRYQPFALGYLQRSVETPVDATLGGAPVCIGATPASSTSRAETKPKNTVSPLSFG